MIRPLHALAWLLIACPLMADDWSAEDDTFDPAIQAVTIGDATWIGDPSPFVHVGASRTGYTHVHTTDYEGIGPAVQISLMVPLAKGESQPPGGGMLMLNKAQTEVFVKEARLLLAAKPDKQPKPTVIKTTFKDADWTLANIDAEGARFLQFENKVDGKVHQYRFTSNATKKLLGAVEHSLKKLDAKPAVK